MSSKTYTKDDLKRLMQEKKQDQLNSKKIDSPLAGYDKSGNLFCKVCELRIENVNFWTKHLVSREHKSVLERLKKSQLNEQTVESKKRKQEDQNAGSTNKQFKSAEQSEYTQPSNISINNESRSSKISNQKQATDQPKGLPLGFFDNPEEDAKARDEIYKDPLEDEWSKFQRTIQEENKVADVITEVNLAEEQNYRDLTEIDEQLEHWKRLNELEIKRDKKRSTIKKMNVDTNDTNVDEESSDEDLEDEFNIISNWRSKKTI